MIPPALLAFCRGGRGGGNSRSSRSYGTGTYTRSSNQGDRFSGFSNRDNNNRDQYNSRTRGYVRDQREEFGDARQNKWGRNSRAQRDEIADVRPNDWNRKSNESESILEARNRLRGANNFRNRDDSWSSQSNQASTRDRNKTFDRRSRDSIEDDFEEYMPDRRNTKNSFSEGRSSKKSRRVDFDDYEIDTLEPNNSSRY